MAQLIDGLENGMAQEGLPPAADLTAGPACTASEVLLFSSEESLLERPVASTDNEAASVEQALEPTVACQADAGFSQKALASSFYLDPETGSITAAFSRELASFYAALLTPVSATARLFLQQTLVSSGDLSVLGRMASEDMMQVRGVLANYSPAASEFFPLYAARVVIGRAVDDEFALRQATLEGVPVLFNTFNLLATVPCFSLLTLQQLTAYTSPVLAALAQMRRHEERFRLLMTASVLYGKASTRCATEEEVVVCGRYSACRMAALSAVHLDRHRDALTVLETLDDELLELDTPRQVLTAIALAQSGRFNEAIETAKYFALLPEVMGPLGFDQYADVDSVPHPEILGSIDLDNPEDGYQYECIDMRLFPAATHLFQFVRQALKDAHFDPNDPFAEDVAAYRAAAKLSRYSSPAVVAPVLDNRLH